MSRTIAPPADARADIVHNAPALALPAHPLPAPATTTGSGWNSGDSGRVPAAPRSKPRLSAVDAARGLALIGMFSIHLLMAYDTETFEPSLQWTLFAGRAAALFALLAGLSLAFSSGGRTPHRGRELTATRAGLVVRAVLVAAVGLCINQVMPSPAPAQGILVYYGAFFVLALPLLSLRRRTLAVCTLGFATLGPALMHVIGPVLPAPVAENLTFESFIDQPSAACAQLLLTGSYPAIPYLTYISAGLLIGRLDLHELVVQVRIAVVGAVLAVSTWFVYWALVLYYEGYYVLMERTPWLSEDQIDEIFNWGPQTSEIWNPEAALPTSTWWWLLTPGPHSNTPVTLLMDLGTGLAVLGVFLLVVRQNWLWNILAAMGGRTLTLYSAHLLALALMVHYDLPTLWFVVHVAVAASFAVLWQKKFGQGPLERVLAAAVRGTRRLVLDMPRRTAESAGTPAR